MFTLQTTLPILVVVLALFAAMYRAAFKRWAPSRRKRTMEVEASAG